jgi:ubiquinone/menaquinone biosynthesis C-methylase UbiE
MIVKSYRRKGCGYLAQDAGSWAGVWDKITDFKSEASFASKDHLSTIFKHYFPFPPGRIIEGGCGTGKYVVAYRNMGYDIVGVDFSTDTIKRIKDCFGSHIPVSEADITALPYPDGYFDCYYSGGGY